MSTTHNVIQRPIHRHDYQPPDYLIDQVELRFELTDSHTDVQARLTLRRRPGAAAGPLVLHGRELELQALRLDSTALPVGAYHIDAERLTIPGVPAAFTLDLTTRIYPHANTALEGLYRSSGNFCTQCEAEGFRKITYFLDRPDVMAVYTTTLVADKTRYPVLLANGNSIASGDLEGGRHYATWHDPFKKPCYLFALVAGDLRFIEDRYTTRSGREVKLYIYVEPPNIEQCEHAMRSLQQAMRWDEEVFGLEYDLDNYLIVAVGDFNMGAMENKGLNIFNTKYVLAKPETATDDDYRAIQGVIAHEYFHNWTGNRVTCRDWFQLSLKEGLTVFRDQEFSADTSARGVKRIDDVRVLRAAQFAEDAGPLAHPVRPDSYIEINNFYTATVYNKGAEVVRMQHTLLGEAGFRRGMDLYFQRHDGQAVTCDDFVTAMEDANGVDFQQLRRWYSQAGTPELTVQRAYDPAGARYTLTIRQHCPPTPGQPDKEPFHIPLALGLLDAQGNDLPLQLAGENAPAPAPTRVLDLRAPVETFHFINIPAAPVPSLLRGFSAPVKLVIDLSDAELMFLLAHDSDDFNRWEAGQQLAQRTLLALVEQRRQGQAWTLGAAFIQAFRSALTAAADPALRAQVLSLPSEGYLAEQMTVADVEGIHAARQFMRRELARALYDDFLALYQAHHEAGTPRLDEAAMAKRALKNLCLDYLMQSARPQALEYCLAQFQHATTMTDELGALRVLANHPGAQRHPALQAFYQRWRHEALVVDKWFALQATAALPDTLAEVQGLLHHEAFSIKNPNKVRALIGSFAHANPAGFHAADGSAYAFIADHVLALNKLNPQVAARLASAFTRWRRYDEGRQAAMRAHLQRLLAAPELSRDVFEIVSKSLQEHAQTL